MMTTRQVPALPLRVSRCVVGEYKKCLNDKEQVNQISVSRAQTRRSYKFPELLLPDPCSLQ
jgi:hypothetical protein